jgi:hypothetical protein
MKFASRNFPWHTAGSAHIHTYMQQNPDDLALIYARLEIQLFRARIGRQTRKQKRDYRFHSASLHVSFHYSLPFFTILHDGRTLFVDNGTCRKQTTRSNSRRQRGGKTVLPITKPWRLETTEMKRAKLDNLQARAKCIDCITANSLRQTYSKSRRCYVWSYEGFLGVQILIHRIDV